jgi:alpha-amylase/alpha-mannosidase (GH57 family)
LEAIVSQPSARPYHDWNKRVNRECYAPNTQARLVDEQGRIQDMVNNYEHLSFNFGPTLLIWLQKNDPWTYGRILAADRKSAQRLAGHGNALAQVYNHIIMPLANQRDRITQIRWGLADFAHRFGRPAGGMWLAETAVDVPTLRDLAAEGVKFTILSPTQAQAVRPLKGKNQTTWRDVSGGGIDTTQPYRVMLDDQGSTYIDVFFYNQELAQAVAFERILTTGDDFLNRIKTTYPPKGAGPYLANVATDGESYGHHFKFGDMALAWVFRQLTGGRDIKVVNYSWYLDQYPPSQQVRLKQPSAWSCAHGVERWRSDCGCNVTHTPGWNQAWRTPLRKGLDKLRDALADIFQEQAGALFKDPWQARDAYISVLLDPDPKTRNMFLAEQAGRELNPEERQSAWRLLESQRMALFMFTSCGWFFDDISNLEVRQVLNYAARAIELTAPYAGRDLEADLLSELAKAKSNLADQGDGAQVYRKRVLPGRMTPERVAANYALPLAAGGEEPRVLEHLVTPGESLFLTAEDHPYHLGELTIHLPSEEQSQDMIYLARQPMDDGVLCLVSRKPAGLDIREMAGHLLGSIESCGDCVPEFRAMTRQVDRFGLDDLIPDARSAFLSGLARRIYAEIRRTMSSQQAAVAILVNLAQDLAEPTAEFMEDLLPFYLAWELERLTDYQREEQGMDWDQLRHLADMAEQKGLSVNQPAINRLAMDFLIDHLERLAGDPSAQTLGELNNMLAMIRELHMQPDLWRCQNLYYRLRVDRGFRLELKSDLSSFFAQAGEFLGFAPEEK